MIICNKCRREIPESYDVPLRNATKEKTAEILPKKRSSLVAFPLLVAANNDKYVDVDLCQKCKTKLNLAIDKIKFDFLKEEDNEENEKC